MKSQWGVNAELVLWVEGEGKEENVGVLGSCQLVLVEGKRKGKGDEYKARMW